MELYKFLVLCLVEILLVSGLASEKLPTVISTPENGISLNNTIRVINSNSLLNYDTDGSEKKFNCSEGYYFAKNSYCEVTKNSVDKAECLLIDSNSKTFSECASYVRNLQKSCDASNKCETDFSECFNGKCYCMENYVKHDNMCYGLPGANCSKPSDCISTSYSCQSGTCQRVDYWSQDNKLVSSKSEITSYWVYNSDSINFTGVLAGKDLVDDVYVCRQFKENITVPGKLFFARSENKTQCYSENLSDENNSSEYYQMLVGSNLTWTNSTYTLDKVVYGGSVIWENPCFICRVTHFNFTAIGMLVPPLYNSCVVSLWDKVYDKFDVLIQDN